MGISARVASGKYHPDYLFETARDKIVLTSLSSNPDDRAVVMSRVTTTLNNNLSLIPSCDCGYITDPLGLGLGTATCPRCHSQVTDGMLKTITPTVFISKPDDLPSLLQPIFLAHFRVAYSNTAKGFDALRYFLDPTYQVTYAPVEALNLPRGIKEFTTNIPQILDALNSLSVYSSRSSTKELAQEYAEQASAIHCNNLYVLNRALVIIDKSPLRLNMQKALQTLLDVVLALIGLNTKKMSSTKRLNRLSRAMCDLVEFYLVYFKEVMAGKTGAVRSNMYGVRAAVGQYAVITSITTHLQHPEEVHLPYTPTLFMLYPQIVGKLIKAGFTQPLAVEYIQRYAHTFNPRLHKFMEEILELDVKGYADIISQRYPTLSKGSIGGGKALKVGNRAEDKSIHKSILGVASFNADFDGDYMVVQPCPPIPEFKRMDMKYNMVDSMKYRRISDNFMLPRPVVTNILYWRKHAIENSRPSPVDVAALYGV